jgi:methylmalonyl-CoA mutase N-terminal domain/subunit
MKEKETLKIQSSYLEGERVANFKTLSGMEYQEVYTPDDVTGAHELPGAYPFTRGIHRTMYRSRLWTRRQQRLSIYYLWARPELTWIQTCQPI